MKSACGPPRHVRSCRGPYVPKNRRRTKSSPKSSWYPKHRCSSYNFSRGLPACCARLSRLPFERLSIAMTVSPRSSSTSTTWEPMNPAAPVTAIGPLTIQCAQHRCRDLGFVAVRCRSAGANADIGHTSLFDALAIERASAIDDHLAAAEVRPVNALILGVARLNDRGIQRRSRRQIEVLRAECADLIRCVERIVHQHVRATSLKRDLNE